MTDNGIHVGDTGTIFLLAITDLSVPPRVVNLVGATLMEMTLVRPDGTKFVVAATFSTDGTDGVIKYVTQSGDLNQAGIWKLQVLVALSGGQWNSSTTTFKVYANQ